MSNKFEIKKYRDSRIELLRIISAIMILAHHIVQHSGTNINGLIQSNICINQIVAFLFGSWGQLGVCIFVIITSWFSIDSGRGVKTKPLVKIILETWTYCAMIVIVYLIAGYKLPYNVLLMELTTPIYPKNYWFITTYIVFWFIIPILRKGLSQMSDRMIKSLCAIMIVLVPVYNLFYQNPGSYLCDFCTIFMITYYIKRNPDCRVIVWRKHILVISLLCSIIGIILLGVIGTILNNQTILNQMVRFHDCRNIFTFFTAFSLFLVFLNMKPFTSRLVNKLSLTSLGVYIISENILVRGDGGILVIWESIFNLRTIYYSGNNRLGFLIALIITIFVTYCIISTIDLTRIYFEDKVFDLDRVKRILKKIDIYFSDEQKS